MKLVKVYHLNAADVRLACIEYARKCLDASLAEATVKTHFEVIGFTEPETIQSDDGQETSPLVLDITLTAEDRPEVEK